MDEREELLKKERERQRKKEEKRFQRERELKRRLRIMAAAAVVFIILLTVGISFGVHTAQGIKAEKERIQKQKEQEALKKEQEEHTIELLAVGDNIAHQAIRESGMSDTGTWKYDHVYQPIKEDVEAADMSVVTQETVFVEDRADVSGYPVFGTPPEFGDALVNTGFDVIAHATNHMLDKGTDSIDFTLDWWKENHPETNVVGIHESQKDAEEITVVQCKALKVAILDYTYGLNGLQLPEDKEYMVDVFDADKARKDIRKAKEMADVVITIMHVGVEYNQDIDEETQQWVNLFLEEGVDVVLGSHPHVVRTMETLTGADGHKMLVYYSLGNLVSTQNDLPSLLGAMAKITIEKDIKTGEVRIPEHEFIPLIMHYNKEQEVPDTKVYKLEDYTQELLEQHSAYKKNPSEFSLDYYQELFETIQNKGNNGEI